MVAATAASEGQLAFWLDARVGGSSTTSYSEQVHFFEPGVLRGSCASMSMWR